MEPLASRIRPKDLEKLWLIPFFETVWSAFVSDYKILGLSERKGPLLYWFERLQERITQAKPPVEKIRDRTGIAGP